MFEEYKKYCEMVKNATQENIIEVEKEVSLYLSQENSSAIFQSIKMELRFQLNDKINEITKKIRDDVNGEKTRNFTYGDFCFYEIDGQIINLYQVTSIEKYHDSIEFKYSRNESVDISLVNEEVEKHYDRIKQLISCNSL